MLLFLPTLLLLLLFLLRTRIFRGGATIVSGGVARLHPGRRFECVQEGQKPLGSCTGRQRLRGGGTKTQADLARKTGVSLHCCVFSKPWMEPTLTLTLTLTHSKSSIVYCIPVK